MTTAIFPNCPVCSQRPLHSRKRPQGGAIKVITGKCEISISLSSLGKILQMMVAVKDLTNSVDELKSPTGRNQKTPARSCLDIYMVEHRLGQEPKNGEMVD